MWHTDARICARAADAVEKVTRKQPELLEPFKKELLVLAAKTTQKGVQWHLAQIMPRLSLTQREWRRAVKIVREYLNSESAILRTSALQALFELSFGSRDLRRKVTALITEKSKKGSPAERARARKLLLAMEKDEASR